MWNSKVHAPCIKDCELRSVEPNCHDATRCCKWALYVEEKDKYNAVIDKMYRTRDVEDYRMRKIQAINRNRRNK